MCVICVCVRVFFLLVCVGENIIGVEEKRKQLQTNKYIREVLPDSAKWTLYMSLLFAFCFLLLKWILTTGLDVTSVDRI